MIEYILHEKNQTVIYQTDEVVTYNESNLSIIKRICLYHLFTYEGYLKAIKYYFNFHYHIPIYIDEELQLFSTGGVKEYENIWINYASIESIIYLDKGIKLTFTSHRILIIALSRQSFHEQIKRLAAIKFHISKHFHGLEYRK